VEAIHERLHQGDAALLAVVEDGGGLAQVAGDGLLTEDVEAGVGGGPDPLGVEAVGQRDVHRVDVGLRASAS